MKPPRPAFPGIAGELPKVDGRLPSLEFHLERVHLGKIANSLAYDKELCDGLLFRLKEISFDLSGKSRRSNYHPAIARAVDRFREDISANSAADLDQVRFLISTLTLGLALRNLRDDDEFYVSRDILLDLNTMAEFSEMLVRQLPDSNRYLERLRPIESGQAETQHIDLLFREFEHVLEEASDLVDGSVILEIKKIDQISEISSLAEGVNIDDKLAAFKLLTMSNMFASLLKEVSEKRDARNIWSAKHILAGMFFVLNGKSMTHFASSVLGWVRFAASTITGLLK